MELKKVVFIGEFLFPSDYASAIRVLNMAKAIRDTGYEVLIISKGIPDERHFDSKTRTYLYEGIRYIPMYTKKNSYINKLIRAPYLFFSYSRILNKLNANEIKAIIVYASPSAIYVPQVIKYCKKNRIKTIGDISEWYDKRQFKGGSINPCFYIFSFMFRYYFHQLHNLICCSTLVQDWFSRRKCNTIRIPGFIDTKSLTPCNDKGTGPIVIIYAGQMGKKDIVLDFIHAISRLTVDEQRMIRFKVFGTTREEFLKITGLRNDTFKYNTGSVEFFNRISRNQIIKEYEKAHFSLLLRPNMRYANAGFPSKIPESLAMGVPVLLNATSDLTLYIKDGLNGFLLNDYGEQTLVDVLRKIMSLDQDAVKAMRLNARKTAEEYFDYRV